MLITIEAGWWGHEAYDSILSTFHNKKAWILSLTSPQVKPLNSKEQDQVLDQIKVL